MKWEKCHLCQNCVFFLFFCLFTAVVLIAESLCSHTLPPDPVVDGQYYYVWTIRVHAVPQSIGVILAIQ